MANITLPQGWTSPSADVFESRSFPGFILVVTKAVLGQWRWDVRYADDAPSSTVRLQINYAGTPDLAMATAERWAEDYL